MEDSIRVCAQLQDIVQGGSFWCDRLEFVVPDEDFHFQERGTFYLGVTREGPDTD